MKTFRNLLLVAAMIAFSMILKSCQPDKLQFLKTGFGKNFLLLCLVLMLVSCNNTDRDITVMTFNIRMDTPADGPNQWKARVPVVSSYLDSVAPDIAGMQEVLHNQLTDLQNMLPGYSYVGTGRDDGKKSGEYSPIFFRDDRFVLHYHSQFWLSETPEVPGSVSWDAAITRIVTWAALEDRRSGRIIYAFNTHFDHRGTEARRKSAGLISEMITGIAGNSPVILLGDFNIRKNSDDYQLMNDVFTINNRLMNAEHMSEIPVTGAETTFNGFRHDAEPRVIDFIFLSDVFTVLFYRVDKVTDNGIFISDHWPVMARIAYSK
jgi:endonuclease/exonuclease/phosphatase family metal-dependent hydrolase